MPADFDSIVAGALVPQGDGSTDDLTDRVVAGSLGLASPKPAMRANVSDLALQSPDNAASQRALAKYVGLPGGIASAIPDEIKRMAAVKRVDQDTADSRVLQAAFAKPEFAAIAHDDSGPLSAVAAAAKYLVSADDKRGLVNDVAATWYNSLGMIAGLGRAGADIASIPLQPLVGTILPANPFAAAAAEFAAAGRTADRRAKEVGSQWDSGPVAQIFGGGASSAVQSILQSGGIGVAASWLLGPEVGIPVTLAALAAGQGGQSYQKGREAGLPVGSAAMYGTADAMAEYVGEKYLGIGGFLKKAFAGASVTKLAVYEITREIPGEVGTTIWQNFNEWAAINPDKSVGDWLAEQPAAIAQTVVATVLGGGGNIAIAKSLQTVAQNAGSNAFEQAQAEQQTQALADLFAKAAATKTRERDPTSFADVVQQAADEGKPEQTSVYVDAKTLVEALQANPEAAGVFNQMPQQVQEQVQEALATGGTVELPIGELTARAAGTPLEQALLPHLRTTREGLSQTEAKEASAQAQADIEAHAERVIAESQQGDLIRAEGEQVRQTVMDALNAVGRNTADVNEAYARLHEAFFTAMADRMGMTPMQLFRDFDLKVRGETVGSAFGQAGKTDSPQFKAWFGDSKVVDAEGKPLVVYHGTRTKGEAIDSFDLAKTGSKTDAGYMGRGFYFGDERTASVYAGHYEFDPGHFPQGGAVYPVHLSLKNPLMLRDRVENGRRVDLEILAREAVGLPKTAAAEEVRAKAEAMGHDGVIYQTTDAPGAYREYVAFRPEQIKSAIGNRGTYDPNDPSILNQAAVSGETEQDQINSLAEARVSPRNPTAVKSTEDTLGETRLQPDLATAMRDPAAFAHNIALMAAYPNFEGLQGTPEEQAEAIIQQAAANLLWLHDLMPKVFRERTKMWYVGGNRIAHRWAKRFGVPVEMVAGVIAATSPQKDWFQNVSLAERILEAVVNRSSEVWTPEMSNTVRWRDWGNKLSKDLKFTPSEQLARFEGKTLRELYDPTSAASLLDMAVWIRAWDETNNPRMARVINPEGGFENRFDKGKGEDGKPIGLRWQTFATMSKTLQILMTNDLRAMSDIIGANHKVRSFYNNIIAPFAGDDVTIDTHAVAAALLRPLGSSSVEVAHNFGGTNEKGQPGPKNSAVSGLYGTYAIHAEAYRRAAEQRGVLPREMQSITWEAVRGLFRPEQKNAANKAATDQIWRDVAAGRLDIDAARERIRSLVGGVADPAWVGSTAGENEATADSSYAGELSQSGAPGGRAGSGAGRGTGSTAAGTEGLNQGANAPRATFNPSTNTIALLASADLSSFLHESAHFFLEVLSDLAAQPTAPQQVKDDWAATLKWFGVKGDKEAGTTPEQAWAAMSLDEQRPHHERWAESFEQYLLEGRAPSLELRGPFQRFRSFLLQVYKSLKDFATGRNLQLNAEVRSVFDRLLATEEQIAQAEEQAKYEAIYRTAEEAGMDEHEWAVYQEMHQQGTNAAIDTMQARSMADMKWAADAHSKALKKEQTKVKKLRDEMKAKVTEEVMASPLEQAREYIADTRQSTPEQKAELAAWKTARQAEVDRSTAAQNAALLAANPDAKGLEKAQLVSKNKKLIANQAENTALQWEKQNPRPQPKLPPVEMDMIAERFGFSSGDEVARTMVEQPAAKDLIEALTEQRLLAEHGEMITPQAIQQAANEAVHNEARARFVATELATMQAAMAQSEQTGTNKAGAPIKVNVLVRAAKEFAKAIVARRKISDLKPGRYTAAERRAGTAVQKAMAAGKTAEAVQAQRDRLLNLYAAKETMAAQEEVDAALSYFARVQKSTTLPVSHQEQINGLLERFKLRETNAASDNRIAFRTWAIAQLQDGEVPPNVEALLSPSARKKLAVELQAKDSTGNLIYEDEDKVAEVIAAALDADPLRSYKELTVEEFRGLRDTVRQIEHIGRRTQKVQSAKDKREYGKTRDRLVAGLNDNAKEAGKLERTSNTWIGRRLDGLKQFGVSHIKPAIWARIFDGGKDNGIWWSTVIRPANERASFEATRRADATSALMDILGPVLKDVPLMEKVGKGKFFPELKTSLNWEERFSILLNMGNASNEQRLMGGGIAGVKQRLTPAEVAVVLKTFTEAELNAAQAVWDHFESYRPEIAAKQLRVEGVEPEWIEPRPFQITSVDGKTVTLKGGYYPVVFDRKGSLKADQHGAAKEAKDAMKAAYNAATTNRSFVKPRVELLNGRPLLLNMQGLFSGVNDVIHDLAWHEWVIDMNRFMRDEAIHESMVDHYGVNVKKEFTLWVEDIVAGQRKLDHGVENAVGWARKFVSASALTYNVMSALIQPLGITQSFSRVGTGWVAQGIGQYLKSPMEATADVRERSEFMRNRTRTMFRDLNELRNRVAGQTTARELMGRYGYFLTMHMQATVDVPTWLGAYAKAIHEGRSDDDAVGLADQAVKDSQGGGEEVDQSGITRGGPFVKLFTAFYEFMNTQANVLYLASQTKSKPEAFMHFALVGVLTPIFGKLLKDALTPGDSGDWDDWKKALRTMINEGLSNLIGMVAFGREFAGVVKRITEDGKSMGYSGPTGLRLVADSEKLMDQIKQGEMDDAFRKALINELGDVSGIPSVQINRSITGAKALKEGKTHNPAALLFGYQEPH